MVRMSRPRARHRAHDKWQQACVVGRARLRTKRGAPTPAGSRRRAAVGPQPSAPPPSTLSGSPIHAKAGATRLLCTRPTADRGPARARGAPGGGPNTSRSSSSSTSRCTWPKSAPSWPMLVQSVAPHRQDLGSISLRCSRFACVPASRRPRSRKSGEGGHHAWASCDAAPPEG